MSLLRGFNRLSVVAFCMWTVFCLWLTARDAQDSRWVYEQQLYRHEHPARDSDRLTPEQVRETTKLRDEATFSSSFKRLATSPFLLLMYFGIPLLCYGVLVGLGYTVRWVSEGFRQKEPPA